MPNRRSRPICRRVRFERCLKMISADAAHADTIAGPGLPVQYAIGGSAIDARTDASEMYFVDHTVSAKIIRAGTVADGVSTEKTPHAVATPFPPRKRSQTG